MRKKAAVLLCMSLITLDSWILSKDGLDISKLINDKWYFFPIFTLTLMLFLFTAILFLAVVVSISNCLIEVKK